MAKIRVTYEFEDNDGYYGTHKKPFKYSKGQKNTVKQYDQCACLENISDDFRSLQLSALNNSIDNFGDFELSKQYEERAKVYETIKIVEVEVTI